FACSQPIRPARRKNPNLRSSDRHGKEILSRILPKNVKSRAKLRSSWMDSADKKILALLQRDASMSIAAIAEAIGASQTPCWRRIQRLEKTGVIRKRVALLDRERLNCDTTAFMMIRTNDHSLEWLENFH